MPIRSSMKKSFSRMKGKVYRPGEVMFHNFIVYGRNKGGNKARSAAVDGGVIVFRDFEGKHFFRSFILGNKLGKGGSGKVFKATVKGAPEESAPYAVKRILRWGVKEEVKQDVLREVEILRSLDHPHVVKVFQFYRSDPTYFYMVLEFMAGGELFDRIYQKEKHTERDARNICKALIDAIKYCHDRSIVHLDIKPQNILLSSLYDECSIKLADFGIACSVLDGPVTTDRGTLEFVAPEIMLRKAHGTCADMWSLGVVVFMLLSGHHPFYTPGMTSVFTTRVVDADFGLDAEEWAHTSDEAKDFVRKLLTVDQTERMTAAEATTDPWLIAPDQSLMGRDLTKNLEVFRISHAKRKLRASFKMYLAAKAFLNLPTENFSRTDDFEETFQLGKEIGKGTCATVYKAIIKKEQEPTLRNCSPQLYAVKRFTRQPMDANGEQRVIEEAHIMRSLQHPNVVRIHYFYQNDPTYFYMVLDFAAGGELFERIIQKTSYNEKEASDLCCNLLRGIKYVHDQRIVHRDIKPENLLLSSSTDDTSVKLAGFGSSCSAVERYDPLVFGTLTYMAPEILNGSKGKKPVDMWSAGTILYHLLAGYSPFRAPNEARLAIRIKAAQFNFDQEHWRGISENAKDLIKNLLVVDPEKRFTADEALLHPWLSTETGNLAGYDLGHGLEQHRIFDARKKLRAAVTAVIVTIKMNRYK